MVLPLKGLKENGGETGIRTLDTLRYTRFPSVRLQPLGHLSTGTTDLTNLTRLSECMGVALGQFILFAFSFRPDFADHQENWKRIFRLQ